MAAPHLPDAISMKKRNFQREKEGTLALLALGFLLTVAISALFIYRPSFFIALDAKFYDILLRSFHSRDITAIPVIVDIDEKSLMRHGQWPWPRYRIAQLLDSIKNLGAASIGLDMVFAEPDRTSLGILKEEIKRDLDLDIVCQSSYSSPYDNDKTLAETLSRGPFTLGYEFAFDSSPSAKRDELAHPIKMVILNDPGTLTDSPGLIQATDIIGNLKEFSAASRASGFFNFAPDMDSLTRRVPLLVAHNGKIYPNLSLATLLNSLKPKLLSLQTTSTGEQFLHLDNRRVPLDGNGQLLVHYRGPRNTFPYVSAADVLSGLTPPGTFQDKIVFLGSSATGLKEFRPTPLDPLFPGVEVHATIVDNILKGDFLLRPSWTTGLELLLVISLGIGSTVLFARSRAWLTLLFTVICSIGVWIGVELSFRTQGIYISPLFPLMIIGINFSTLNLFKYWREEQKVRHRDKDISIAQEFTIQCLASLAETRDTETGGHIMRTQQYVRALCGYLSGVPKFHGQFTAETIEMICKATPLHDIGKVGIPDEILLKKGKLTCEEFELMKKHTIYGRSVIINAQERLGGNESSNLFLDSAKDLIYTHHEKWDGSGYPQGLKGEDIPVSGRLMALADVYDALISKRVYKKALSHEIATRIIVEGRGKHFDPDVVDAFLQLQATFEQIASEFADHGSEG